MSMVAYSLIKGSVERDALYSMRRARESIKEWLQIERKLYY